MGLIEIKQTINMKKYLSIVLMLICTFICEAQTIEDPVFDRTDNPSFRVEKFVITKDTTYIYCYYTAEGGTWANIIKGMYLRDVKTNKRYPLLKCDGLPYSPDKETFKNSKRCEVKLYFEPICNVKKVDLIENPNKRAFNIYGIDFGNQYKEKYSLDYLYNLAKKSLSYDYEGDTTKAIQYKKEEVEAVKYNMGKNSEEYLNSIYQLAVMYDKYGFYTEATGIMVKVLEMHAEIMGTFDSKYALQLLTLAQIYSHSGYREKSIQTFKASISKYESLDIWDINIALAHRLISEEYKLSGDIKKAIEHQKKAIELKKIICGSEGYLE